MLKGTLFSFFFLSLALGILKNAGNSGIGSLVITIVVLSVGFFIVSRFLKEMRLELRYKYPKDLLELHHEGFNAEPSKALEVTKKLYPLALKHPNKRVRLLRLYLPLEVIHVAYENYEKYLGIHPSKIKTPPPKILGEIWDLRKKIANKYDDLLLIDNCLPKHCYGVFPYKKAVERLIREAQEAKERKKREEERERKRKESERLQKERGEEFFRRKNLWEKKLCSPETQKAISVFDLYDYWEMRDINFRRKHMVYLLGQGFGGNLKVFNMNDLDSAYKTLLEIHQVFPEFPENEMLSNAEIKGYGELVHDGHKYEGTFDGENLHGYGKLLYSDGRVYEGGFKDNTIHGKGVMTAPDGEKIYGIWKDNEMEREIKPC